METILEKYDRIIVKDGVERVSGGMLGIVDEILTDDSKMKFKDVVKKVKYNTSLSGIDGVILSSYRYIKRAIKKLKQKELEEDGIVYYNKFIYYGLDSKNFVYRNYYGIKICFVKIKLILNAVVMPVGAF